MARFGRGLLVASRQSRVPFVGVLFDAASSSSIAIAGTTLSWSHVVGTDPNRLLLVGVSLANTLGQEVSGVTFGAQTLTFIGAQNNGSSGRVEVWSLVAPTSGSGTITVTFTAAAVAVAGATSLSRVNQTDPVANFTSATGSGTSASVTVPLDASTDLAQDVVASVSGTLSAGAGQTQRWNVGVAGVVGAGSTEPGTSSVVMSWTNSASVAWVQAAVDVHYVGISDLTQTASPSAIGSSEALGSATVTPGPAAVNLSAIGSAEAIGTSQLNQTAYASAIGSSEALGAAVLSAVLFPPGLASGESLGAAVLSATLYGTGIGSSEAFGTASAVPGAVAVSLTAIGSSEALGSAALALAFAPTGLSTSEAIGTAALSPGPVEVDAFGIASGESLGSAALVEILGPAGIADPSGPTYSAIVLAHGPRAWWRLDETSGDTAADSSGSGHPLFLSTAPTLGVAGLLTDDTDLAARWDTDAAYGYVSDEGTTDTPVNLAIRGLPFTYVAWIETDGGGFPAGDLNVVYEASGQANHGNSWLGVDTGGHAYVNSQGDDYSQNAVVTGPIVTDSAVHRLTVTGDGTTLRLYVDGSEVGSTAYAPMTGGVGSLDGTTFVGGEYVGVLDEVAIYDRALTAEEDAAEYAAGISGGQFGAVRLALDVAVGAIGSGEQFGAVILTAGAVALLPAAIASGESVGVGLVQQILAASGVGTGESVGLASLVAVLAPDAIAAGESFGDPSVLPGVAALAPNPIASAEQFGATNLSPGTISVLPGAVGSTEAWGSPNLVLALAPDAIGSSEALGAALLGAVLAPAPVDSAEEFGDGQVINPGTLDVFAIPSGQAFGGLTATTGPVSVLAEAVSSAEVFGDLVAALVLAPVGVGSEEALGSPAAALGLALASLGPDEAFGTLSVAPGAVSVDPAGVGTDENVGLDVLVLGTVSLVPDAIGSEEAFGTPILSALVLAPAVASEEAFGAATLVPGPISLVPDGVGSSEAFGPAIVVTGVVHLLPDTIPSAEALGAVEFTVGPFIDLAGFGVSSSAAFGLGSLLVGAVNVVPVGIAPGQMGVPILYFPVIGPDFDFGDPALKWAMEPGEPEWFLGDPALKWSIDARTTASR